VKAVPSEGGADDRRDQCAAFGRMRSGCRSPGRAAPPRRSSRAQPIAHNSTPSTMTSDSIICRCSTRAASPKLTARFGFGERIRREEKPRSRRALRLSTTNNTRVPYLFNDSAADFPADRARRHANKVSKHFMLRRSHANATEILNQPHHAMPSWCHSELLPLMISPRLG
jgi:hypothetical protein